MGITWIALSLTLLLFICLVKDKTRPLEKMIVLVGFGQMVLTVFEAFSSLERRA